ncbi:hypothetical protein [Pseudolysinimonas sp.]|jgi:hypothetical protein|uniref:hypothetical protein n=1 Tax=Pseudolysinimonas sp. TaxID=2680009 RepID=UPI0037846DBD
MTLPIRPDPARLTRAERVVGSVVRVGARVPGLRRFLLWPVVARPGYWFATACAWLWGRLLFGRYTSGPGIHYFSKLPTWAYGRGGTTIGAIYLTTDNVGADVLEHEAVHRAQWKKYGLVFIALYVAAGSPALTNRFEVEAGLEKGGYVRPRKPRPGGFPGRGR